MIRCNNCGLAVDDSELAWTYPPRYISVSAEPPERVCPLCGSGLLEEVVECAECGELYAPDLDRCPYCGEERE